MNKILHYLAATQYKEYLPKSLESQKVLEIGYGGGVLKTLVTNLSGTYVGIDANKDNFNNACNSFGETGFLHGYFPQDFPTDTSFDYVICFTTLDEVKEKQAFLEGIQLISSKHTQILISVRNGDSPLLLNKTKPSINGNITDIGREEYKELFKNSRFHVVKENKFIRPWLVNFSRASFKNIVIRIFSALLPANRSYLILFELRKIA